MRPATTERVVLKAHVDGGGSGRGDVAEREVEGQVAVMHEPGRIRRVELVPGDVPADPIAVAAIRAADQVVLAPGSLFTSVLPVLAVAEIRDAVAATAGQVVQVGNLAPQVPETEGLDGVDHLRAVLEHGAARRFPPARARSASSPPATTPFAACGVELVCADIAAAGGTAHDPARLARALADLLDS